MALARAFCHRPPLLFADEPTGNLDSATGARIIEPHDELNRDIGTTLVLVTHDPELAARPAGSSASPTAPSSRTGGGVTEPWAERGAVKAPLRPRDGVA